MSWKDWPPHERNFKSDMDQVFWNKWNSRLNVLRTHMASRCPYIHSDDKETITSGSWTTLNPLPLYIWIPPYVEYLVCRWLQQLTWDGSTNIALCEGQVIVGSHTGTQVRTILSDDESLGDAVDADFTGSANEWAFAKGSIVPNPHAPAKFGPSDWGNVYEIKLQVRTGPGCINTRVYTENSFWHWADEETRPVYVSDFVASEF
jgi:hypothetical protein